MPLRTCVVSYHDNQFERSVEVVAETLHEAAVLGIKALNVNTNVLHLCRFHIRVKQPEVYHSISGAALCAWLAREAKNTEEQELKTRLGRILRGTRSEGSA